MMHARKQWRPLPYRPMPDTDDEWQPPAWFEWTRLCKLSPELRQLHDRNSVNQKRPPRPMSDAAFASLAACFADQKKRRILAALLLDVMADDLLELIQAAILER